MHPLHHLGEMPCTLCNYSPYNALCGWCKLPKQESLNQQWSARKRLLQKDPWSLGYRSAIHFSSYQGIDTMHVLTFIYLRRQQDKGQNTDWSSPQAHMHAHSNALTGFLDYLWNKLIFWGIGYVELPIMIIQNFRQVSRSIKCKL